MVLGMKMYLINYNLINNDCHIMIIYHALRFFHLISGASHFSKTFEDRGEWSNIREVCIIILYNVCKLIVRNGSG